MSEVTDQVVLYKAPDGSISINVKLQGETVWLSLNQMADLFDRDKSVISRHLRNVLLLGNYNGIQLLHFLQQFKLRADDRLKGRSSTSILIRSFLSATASTRNAVPSSASGLPACCATIF